MSNASSRIDYTDPANHGEGSLPVHPAAAAYAREAQGRSRVARDAYEAAVAVIEAGGVTVSPTACRALLAACRAAVDATTPEVPSPR